MPMPHRLCGGGVCHGGPTRGRGRRAVRAVGGGAGTAPVVSKNGVAAFLWTSRTAPSHAALLFGESKTPGVHHLRIGFKATGGSVLVRGGGTLSVLKASAAALGKLEDESAWLPTGATQLWCHSAWQHFAVYGFQRRRHRETTVIPSLRGRILGVERFGPSRPT